MSNMIYKNCCGNNTKELSGICHYDTCGYVKCQDSIITKDISDAGNNKSIFQQVDFEMNNSWPAWKKEAYNKMFTNSAHVSKLKV